MDGTKKITVAVLFGLGTLLLLASLTSLCMALLLKITKINESSLVITIFVFALISMLVAGFVSGVKAKVKGWLVGGTTGVAYSFLVFLVNYLGYSQSLSSENMLYHAGLIATSMIGGIFGVNVAKKE
ncbi:TIGR04086 family membrane protein [Microbacteriaceae bacterium 4G12]